MTSPEEKQYETLLAQYNADISVFERAEDVRGVIDWSKGVRFTAPRFIDLDIPDSSWTRVADYLPFATIVDNPSILIDRGASLCTLLLTLDAEGDGVLTHAPLDGLIGTSDLEVLVAVDMISRHFGLSSKYQQLTIISGTNASRPLTLESSQRVIEKVKEEVSLKSKDVIVLQSGSDELSTNYNIRFVYGIIFIPRQLTLDGRNKIFLLERSSGRELNKIFN